MIIYDVCAHTQTHACQHIRVYHIVTQYIYDVNSDSRAPCAGRGDTAHEVTDLARRSCCVCNRALGGHPPPLSDRTDQLAHTHFAHSHIHSEHTQKKRKRTSAHTIQDVVIFGKYLHIRVFTLRIRLTGTAKETRHSSCCYWWCHSRFP